MVIFLQGLDVNPLHASQPTYRARGALEFLSYSLYLLADVKIKLIPTPILLIVLQQLSFTGIN